MKKIPFVVIPALLFTLLALTGCTTLRDKPKISSNDELLPAEVLELPNVGDLTLKEMETGVWIQMDPDSVSDISLLTKPKDGPYRLGVGDQLEITLYGEGDAETRRVLLIDPAGNITYMLLGTIPAAGRTVDELTADMRARIRAKLNYVILNIGPVKLGSQTFTVLGQLNKPQVYPLQGRTYLLDAIAMAGGPKVGVIRDVSADIHDYAHATLVRGGEVIPVDFERLVNKADASQNIEVLAGDIITIPSALERKIYALGSFNNPQGVQFASSQTSLMNVLVQAGGINTAVGDGHVLIIRGNTANPKVMLMDMSQFDTKKARVFKILGGRSMDITLQAGDIVYAVPKKFGFFRDVLKQAITTFGTTLSGDVAREVWQQKIDPFNFGKNRPL
ncbi:MAG: polysaccharide export protein [Verrucomicrobia bacterium]|nr:polysaccharide export protein [Verrucomicrobiota bacterium]